MGAFMGAFRGIFFCAIGCATSGLLLAGCGQDKRSAAPGTTQESPESWQEHLKPTSIDKTTPIAMEEEIYVPIYSHIYVENEHRTCDLAATLSFRNIDPEHSIIIKSVRYYSSDGKLLKEYLTTPVILNPLATADFVIAKEDTTGGAGANFLVDWVAQTIMVEPLAEAVMVGTGSPQSMSFTSRGIVIKKTLTPKKKSDTTHKS